MTDLDTWLRRHNVDTAEHGKAPYKTVSHLFDEASISAWPSPHGSGCHLSLC